MSMPAVGRRIWSSTRTIGRHATSFFGQRCHYSKTNSVVPTCVRYPEINSQKKDFAKLNPDDIKAFREILDPARVLTEDLDNYNVDWLRSVKGLSECVLKPKTTAEVSAIVQYCYKRGLPICPQGGNTGLVGGSVPVFDEIVLSTELMTNIEELDENSGIVTLQSGVILEKLDNFLSNYGLMAPLDLGAKGSCRLGGNVSTNAGGLRLLRYGSLHANVLGVEAVLAQEGGPVLDCLRVALKKDNTGYDLKHLFIGSEGTLGIVTKIALFCPPRPTSVMVAFLQISTFQDVLEIFRAAKRSLGEIISSFEFIDYESMKCVTENLSLSCPLELSENSFYILIETSGSHSAHDDEKLNAFIEDSLNSGRVVNGIMANEPSKILQLWALRERIAEALMRDGYCYKYDISLPLNVFYDAILEMRQRLGSRAIRCIGYGHIGDGNLHLNITSREYDVELYHSIEPFIYEWTHKNKGSISAEHGIGFKKREHLHFSKPDIAIQLMHQLKSVFDPKGILNPYKVLPS